MQFFQQRERFAVGGLEPKAVRDFRTAYAEDVRKLNEYKQFFDVHGWSHPDIEHALTDAAYEYMRLLVAQHQVDFVVESRLTREEALSREKYAWTLYDGTTVHQTPREFARELVFLDYLVALFRAHHDLQIRHGQQMYSHARKAAF